MHVPLGVVVIKLDGNVFFAARPNNLRKSLWGTSAPIFFQFLQALISGLVP